MLESRSGLDAEIIRYLMQYPEESAAYWLRDGIKNFDTNPKQVIEVITSNTAQVDHMLEVAAVV